MFPLIGLLFVAAAAGIAAGFLALFFKRTRVFAAYLFLCPTCAAVLSFCFFWGAGLIVEKIFGPSGWSNVAALIGYLAGLVIGALLGLFFADRLIKIFFSHRGI